MAAAGSPLTNDIDSCLNYVCHSNVNAQMTPTPPLLLLPAAGAAAVNLFCRWY